MKTARMTTVPTVPVLLSHQAAHLVSGGAEAMKGILRVALLGALLLAILRIVFEVAGSQSSSIAQTVIALSQWMIAPFSQFSALGAAIAATVSLVVINGIIASLDTKVEYQEVS